MGNPIGRKSAANSQSVVIASTGSAILTSVAASATTVPFLVANANRSGAYFFNDSTATLYLALAATASTSAFTIALFSNGYYELPQPAHLGAISGVWSSATGSVRITEIS